MRRLVVLICLLTLIQGADAQSGAPVPGNGEASDSAALEPPVAPPFENTRIAAPQATEPAQPTPSSQPAAAPNATPGSSSESSYYRRGYGFKDANVFNPKFKERLKNLLEQINMGETKGWVNPQQAASLRAEQSRITDIESDIAARNYPKEELDDLEKQINFFNVTVSQSLSKGSPPPPAEVQPSAAPNSESPTPGAPANGVPKSAAPNAVKSKTLAMVHPGQKTSKVEPALRTRGRRGAGRRVVRHGGGHKYRVRGGGHGRRRHGRSR